MTFDVSEEVARAIRRRLCARHAELDEFCKALNMPMVPATQSSVQGFLDTDEGCTPDPEEALRLCMVRYVPRLTQGALRPEQLDEYLRLLRQIGEHCVTDDLRYLDAYHVAYELLRQRGDFQSSHILRQFLNCYRIALSAYMSFLDERDVNRVS